ncbi:hypothetical protein GO685_02595 [Wolbachia endosymbiont of Madathamugadia hiepei]|uniref:hypothetical protein n=1 Tax=Wolbachia endosymbiont of Madathamugadia hiepei TaxID=1241303 RepID=UPI00158A20D2|nr:hypothetical protein [Wolbachia endosymbiont of Madathamugadia hiepei]NUX01393.1 hypothetical protein [Wolbachia endosymbiont of Madathamugadia hiepei]
MVRIAGDDSCLGIGCVASGYDTNQHKGFAFAGGFSRKLVKGGDGKASGIDVGFGLSVRTGANKQEAERPLVSVKKVYHEKIRKDVAKTGSLT